MTAALRNNFNILTVFTFSSDEINRISVRSFPTTCVTDRQNTEQFTRVVDRSYYSQGTPFERWYVVHCSIATVNYTPTP